MGKQIWLVNYGNTSFQDITNMMLKDMDSRIKKIAKKRTEARSTQLQKNMDKIIKLRAERRDKFETYHKEMKEKFL